MKKIIFLDFDGVLHSEIGAHFTKLKLFEEYLRQMPEIEVIISSSWREDMTLFDLKNIFSPDIRDKICGATPVLNEGFLPGGRQKEIELYLHTNNLNEQNAEWIAVDDISEFFNKNCSRLIEINSKYGFTEDDGKILLEWYKQTKFLDKLQLAAANKVLNVTG
jgi:hypothetical protein